MDTESLSSKISFNPPIYLVQNLPNLDKEEIDQIFKAFLADIFQYRSWITLLKYFALGGVLTTFIAENLEIYTAFLAFLIMSSQTGRIKRVISKVILQQLKDKGLTIPEELEEILKK